MKLSFFMLILLCICAAILTALLGYSQYRTTISRDDDYRRLVLQSNALQTQVNELLQEQVRLSETLRARDAELKSTPPVVVVTNTVPAPATNNASPYRQSFYAKAYLDGEFVGLAKVSPVFRTDDATGNTVFENIVTLSADARGAIVKTVTNVVEREVVRNTTLNRNYSTAPYWYGYPVWVRPDRTNGIPGQPNPNPPVVSPPATGSGQFLRQDGTPYWQNGGVWKPGVIQNAGP